jgi:hypothetical protein
MVFFAARIQTHGVHIGYNHHIHRQHNNSGALISTGHVNRGAVALTGESLGPNSMLLLSGQAAVLTDGSQQIFLRATPVVQQCCSATTFGTFDENAITTGARQLLTVDDYRFICKTLNDVQERHRKPAVAWLFALWIGEYFIAIGEKHSQLCRCLCACVRDIVCCECAEAEHGRSDERLEGRVCKARA